MPNWLLGDLIKAVIVKGQLKNIFDYREKTFTHLLETIQAYKFTLLEAGRSIMVRVGRD